MSFWDYTKYAGPIGYGLDKATGHNSDTLLTSYLDPGDLLNKESAKDVGKAGKEAQAYLQQLSQIAWDRQMQGLQRALGSMNNYNGVLANLYGVPTNYYDPSQMGGVQGAAPWAPRPSTAPPAAPPPPPVATGPATQSRNGRGAF